MQAQRRWILLAVIFLLLSFSQLAGAPPATEGRLLGNWMSDDGQYQLIVRDDRTAVLEKAGASADAEPSHLFGKLDLHGGVWSLTVRDVDNRRFHYSVHSVAVDSLVLRDVNGGQIKFERKKPAKSKPPG